jgi:hypothetical protein
MGRSTKKVTPKKRGRPATGKDPARTFRLSDEFIATVDAWAAAQEDDPGRSEAIRRLVELGLTVKTPATTTSKPGRRSRARELSAEAIDKMADLDGGARGTPASSHQRTARVSRGAGRSAEVEN